jgi:DDE superfamily endonuclease
LSVNGESGFLNNAWPVFKIVQGAGDRAVFPPKIVVQIKALACELPCERGLPLSRFSHADIAREAMNEGIVASISGTTVWRWLNADAIKPWQYRSWIFPRDPDFAEKAGRILDLYQGIWEGKKLRPNDYVISTDEKTSIQARNRSGLHTASKPGRCQRIEFEYERAGSLAYLAAWDVRRAKVFGLCENTTGIEPYHRLVDLVMQQEPYSCANRVFWVADNGSSHRGQKSIDRMAQWYPNSIQVHTPVHASWLNQIEIYFSIVQRKVLTPNDFTDLKTLEQHLLDFQVHYEKIAKPFKWKFTKTELNKILSRLPSENLIIESLAA